MEYIEIDKELIPYQFDITLADETYTFNVDYNYPGDFFTVDLFKNDEPIVIGEKLVYGKRLFTTIEYKDIPDVGIMPFDYTGNSEVINYETLGKDVFLYLVGVDDEFLG